MRTKLELEGLAAGLALSGGRAPDELGRELLAGRTPGLELDAKALRSLLGASLSLACLLLSIIVSVTADVGALAPAPRHASSRPAAPDSDAREAILLVQDWRAGGDEMPVLGRLGGVLRHPGGVRAWSAEKTDEGAYLVIYREAAGTPVYAFEVDLESEAVQATPEAVERLTLLRVRDEAAAARRLLASTH